MMDFLSKGGFFIWPILLCSIISLTVILERALFFRRTRIRNKNLPERTLALLNAKKPAEAAALCESEGSFLSRFLSVGLKVADRPEEEKQKILRRAGSRELEAGEKYLRILSVIGNISTLLGLLGTVTGMVQTFRTIQEAGGMADVTVAGLCVAIPTLVCFHSFESIVDDRAIQMKNTAFDILKVH